MVEQPLLVYKQRVQRSQIEIDRKAEYLPNAYFLTSRSAVGSRYRGKVSDERPLFPFLSPPP